MRYFAIAGSGREMELPGCRHVPAFDTTRQSGEHGEQSMVRSIRRSTRFLPGALALALAVVPSATCLTAAEMTPVQKACCAAMNGDCGAMAVEKGCCPSDSPNVASLLSSTSPSQLAPPALVPVSLPATQPDLPNLFRTLFDSGAAKSSSPPTYLLVSLFRI